MISSRFQNAWGKVILAIAGCTVVSVLSLLIFILPFSQNVTIGVPEVCSFLMQLGGCIFIGWKIAQKTSYGMDQEKKARFLSAARRILPVLLVVFIAYVAFPKFNWKISDFILYAGVKNQIDYSLQNCAFWKLFVIKKVISVEAVLAFISCFAAYTFVVKKAVK